MARFRYDTSGKWFKGNVHVHTTLSDGGKTPQEVAELYAAAGYHFLCRADHWVTSNVAAEADPAPLLWLDGIELDGEDPNGVYYHVVCLGRLRGISGGMGLVDAMTAAREQGALLVLAHPYWSGNTFDDALRYPFDGVEIYNHVCRWLNGKGDGLCHWDLMLRSRPGVVGLAVDDAHLRPEHPGWNGGWVMVNAQDLTTAAIAESIRAGNFYSSCGPEFESIELVDGAVRVRTSPVSFVRLVGPDSSGRRTGAFDGRTFTEATFTIPPEWPVARVEIEDAGGRRAWTNPLFVTGAGTGT